MVIRQNLFKKIEEQESIFANEYVFNLEYLPEELLFREKELEEIAHHFWPLLKNKPAPSPLLMLGPSGVGKTALARYVLNQFSEYGRKSLGIYVNMLHYPTRYAVLVHFLEEIGVPTSRRGKAPDELLETLELESNEGVRFAVVLDEVDKARGQEVERLLGELSYLSQKGHLAMVLIAGSGFFLKRLDERVKTLLSRVMRVKPYEPPEIKAILMERARTGFIRGRWVEESISVATALTMKKNANLKYGIQLLYEAGKLAEREGESLMPKHVKAAVREAEIVLRELELEGLSEGEKKVYRLIERLAPLTTGELYKKLKNMNERTVRNYLKRLEEKGLIRLTPLYSSTGNTRMIEL